MGYVLSAGDESFHMRLQEWLDDQMDAEERAIFETELGADPEKADLAEKSKRINDNLKV